MKIQCACGARFSFDVTPEMTATVVPFVCPTCGLNSTALVNQLIQQHVAGVLPVPGGRATTILPGPVEAAPGLASASPVPVAPVPVAVAIPAARPVVRLAIQTRAAEPAASTPDTGEPQPCPKHFGQFLTNHCCVCQKPVCPQCMALFGWVCSPLCRNKAETLGIAIPEYEGQSALLERKQWRKTARTAGAVAAAVALLLGLWIWYEWFGSIPRMFFSAKFPEASSSGELRGGPRDQIILLHGGTLYRHDVKARREVWSVPLIDERQFAAQASVASKAMERGREAAVRDGANRDDIRLPSLSEITEDLVRTAMAAMSLHVQGENIWVESDGKLVRHDWDTGKVLTEIVLDANSRGLSRRGTELFALAHNESGNAITRINLATGEAKQENVPAPEIAARTNAGPILVARGRSGTAANSNAVARAGVSSNLLARSGLRPGTPQLDPARIARNVQNLPLPNRLALPATLAAAANQERLRAELNGADPVALESLMADALSSGGDALRVIPTANGWVQFSARLLERRLVTRKAMKEAPSKSALDGPVNQAATMAIANEILNDIARDRGGDTVQEDESRYQITVRRPGAPDWTGEVVGEPGFLPLDTVDVVTGGKSIVILDKQNKKLWEAKLTYDVVSGGDFDRPFGAGPAVERGDTLCVFDAGVLTAFELRTGAARWRMPSVGIAGLFFDDKGMIYVNTTTASHDSVRYSRQIDVSQKTRTMVLKVDPRTGKTLWRAENQGMVRYLSGKLIYAVESSAGDDGGLMGMKITVPTRSYIRIVRLKPSNGRVLWDLHKEGAPLDYQFDKNEIRILLSKELQVFRFLTL